LYAGNLALTFYERVPEFCTGRDDAEETGKIPGISTNVRGFTTSAADFGISSRHSLVKRQRIAVSASGVFSTTENAESKEADSEGEVAIRCRPQDSGRS
jgi:hypothetical protein